MDTNEIMTNVSEEAVDQIAKAGDCSKTSTGLIIGGLLTLGALATYGAVKLSNKYIIAPIKTKMAEKKQNESDQVLHVVEDVDAEIED